MRKIMEILTPENVYIEYELAGLGSRFAALFIDTAIQIGTIILIILGATAGSMDFKNGGKPDTTLIVVGIILFFIVFFGYFIIFELLMNGQTPGKKIINLRVVKENGGPINIFDSLLRNILRIADSLPLLNLTGAVFIIFSKHYKRIGDYAANTIVIKTGREEKPEGFDALLADGENTVNIYPVNNFEYGILKEFLLRRNFLGDREPVFAYHLNNYFRKKFGIGKEEQDVYAFFEKIIKLNAGV